VEGVMIEIFHKSDADGSGSLSLPEFEKCCKDADIGLTKKEVRVLMVSCDQDGDGSISYEEFVPLCFEMLTEILKDEMLQEKKSSTQLETFLVEVWSAGDADGSNRIDALALKNLLKQADLGLTRLQIHSILSEADYDEAGYADYTKFAPKAAELVYRMLDMDAQIQKAEMVKGMLADGQTFETVHGKNQADLEALLRSEFAASDAAGSGLLSVADLRKALAGSQLQLAQVEIHGLASAADPDEGGMCAYANLAAYAFFILQYLAQEAATR
jgi:Ca2+-binding EF-hand superfamily protein